MAREKRPFEELKEFLPEGSYEFVLQDILQYKVQLTLTQERKTVLGTYMHPFAGKGHRITVNSNLNKYSFLVTLLHELAHLFTYEKYKGKVAPHGKEWKHDFAEILKEYLQKNIFPGDVASALLRSLKNPGASTCADIPLQLALKKYDPLVAGMLMVQDLVDGQLFQLTDGRTFKRGERQRTRFRCEEVNTRKLYLFSKLYEVCINVKGL